MAHVDCMPPPEPHLDDEELAGPHDQHSWHHSQVNKESLKVQNNQQQCFLSSKRAIFVIKWVVPQRIFALKPEA